MLFRGRCGKSRERWGFCFRTWDGDCVSGWDEEANSLLWLFCIILLRNLLRNERKGLFPQHILYSTVYVTCTPVCTAFSPCGGTSTHFGLCTCLIFFSTQWWAGDSSYTACLLFVVGTASRCFFVFFLGAKQGGLTFPRWSLSFPMWQRRLGIKTVSRGSCSTLRMLLSCK